MFRVAPFWRHLSTADAWRLVVFLFVATAALLGNTDELLTSSDSDSTADRIDLAEARKFWSFVPLADPAVRDSENDS